MMIWILLVSKLSKEQEQSLQRLNDQYLLAKEKGDTLTMKNIKKVIDRIKNKK